MVRGQHGGWPFFLCPLKRTGNIYRCAGTFVDPAHGRELLEPRLLQRPAPRLLVVIIFDLSGQIVRIGVSIGVGTTTPFGPQETTELRRWPAGSFSVPLP